MMHVMACNLACNMTCNRARRGRSGAVRSGAQRRPGTLRRSLKVSMAILICGHKVTARYALAPAAHGGPRRRAAAGADGRAGTLRRAVAALRPRRYAAAGARGSTCADPEDQQAENGIDIIEIHRAGRTEGLAPVGGRPPLLAASEPLFQYS